jgi:nicotinate-nucleotide adenylyltransferase
MADGEQPTPASVGAGPRYGIFGGTFDPPHLAHLIVAQEAFARLELDRVYFVPTGQPPHKRGHAISSAADRRAMVERAIDADPRFALSTIELDRAGPSYTVETLRRLRAAWGPLVALDLIVGWDMLLDLPHWYDPAGVVAAASHVVAVHRPGSDPDPNQIDRVRVALPELPTKLIVLPVPQLAISASEVRARVASSLPIRYYVPDSVAQYIADRGIYRPGDVTTRASAGASIGARPSGNGCTHAGYLRAPCVPHDERAPHEEGHP